MKQFLNRFDFTSDTVPSLAEMIARVQPDPEFPEKRRPFVLSSLRRIPKWTGRDANTIPFIPPTLRPLLAGMSPTTTGVSGQRLRNARSDVNFVLAHYKLGGMRQHLAPFTPEVRRLWDRLDDKYEKTSVSRFCRYLSARRISPRDVTDAVADEFLDALERDETWKDPRNVHKNTIRAWNKAVEKYAEWPDRPLTMPDYRKVWAQPWSAFGPLGAKVDAFLNEGSQTITLFADDGFAVPLKESTIRTQKDHFRCVASALVKAGKPIEAVRDLGDLCAPEPFKLAIKWIVEQRQGDVNAYIRQIGWTLTKAARYAKVLEPTEIEEVNRLFKQLTNHAAKQSRTRTDRDQRLLEQFDNVGTLDNFLSLPTRTIKVVCSSGTLDRRAALQVQKAVALELWLCAPLRIGNFAALRLDEHVLTLTIDGQHRIVLRIPADEVKNAQPLEHFLHEDAAAMIELYLAQYRSLLVDGPSPWFFPGRKDKHKDAAVLRRQMQKFIRDGAGVEFHPHLIRKIVAKIYLDAEPGGIEIVRRCLGHRDTRTTRAIYTQQQQRAVGSPTTPCKFHSRRDRM